MNFRVFVSGIPKGQPRPRAFARNGRARVYDPGTAENWKGAVALALRPYISATPITAPISLSLRFRFPRPKSHFRRNGDLRESAPMVYTSKPDADNAAKAVMDAMTEIGIWSDDALICSLMVTKGYVSNAPGCWIALETVD